MIAALALAVASLPFVAATAGAQELSRTERQVRRELVPLRYYSVFDNMTFRVDGGKVTLMGKVTRPTLKTRAEKSIKGIEGIEGIREIDNQIEVLPVSSNDDRIRVATFRAIYYHPMMTR